MQFNYASKTRIGELRKDYRFEGVNSIINREFSNKKVHSDQTEKSVMVKPDAGSRPKVKRYTSSCRSLAMKLCNWGFSDSAKNRKEYLSRLEANDEFERAAAISLFNLDMKTAVETLSRGAMIRDAREESKSNLHLVAMALSGYTNDKRAFWTKMCNDYRSMLLHPYLRAAFAFITSYDGGKFDDVIWTEPDLQLRDRIAFACMFLDDETLQNYVAPLTYEVISTGNLEGIILTGFTTDGLKLLQKFVDKTGDIQTASLAVIHGIPSAISNNERVLSWIESYREFLDRLELWHYRCKLDILRKRNRHTTPPPQTAFLSCNNCSKPINLTASDFTSPNAKYVPRIPIALQKQIKNASFDRCRNCGKALPKCAICLRNMCLDIDRLPNDTKSANILMFFGSHTDIDVDGGKVMYPKKRFNSWFSWCQSCRHGGHATHMESWFANHNECPVQDCNCSCSARDSSFFAIKMCDQV
ncbi:WD repeat-containing protein mio-B [Trichoplax sp. H2]|nr:WD repeat-containing protein mio-B [Trichoplax sp. H2]|eukprot:RDD42771.1 WD repeat-containing protein mio-B [Trichoplax sp. H2]